MIIEIPRNTNHKLLSYQECTKRSHKRHGGDFDHRFGVHYDYELDKLSIGDFDIKFAGNDNKINTVLYKHRVYI